MYSKTSGRLYINLYIGYLYVFLYFLNWRGRYIYYVLIDFYVIKKKIF